MFFIFERSDLMITLLVLGIIVLAFIFALVTLAGGLLVVFIDPIIAILIIVLVVKLIKWIISKFRK